MPLVFAEAQSKSVRAFVERELALPGYTSFYSLIEMESALSRRIAEGSLVSDLAEVRLQLGKLEEGLSLVWPTNMVLSDSRKGITQYNLRPGDALQLATCQTLLDSGQELFFVCLDNRLNKSATASQLRCVF